MSEEEKDLSKAIIEAFRKVVKEEFGNNTPPHLTDDIKTINALDTLTKHTTTCTDPDCLIKNKLQKMTPKIETVKCEECETDVPKGEYCINCGEELETEEEE